MLSIYSDTGFMIYVVVLTVILGAIFGSFLNCTAYRIAHGESFVKGRSHCTSCGHELSALDLIPILSWVFLKGKCRYCGEKVSARYPLTEAFFALLMTACLLKFDLTPECLRNMICIGCLFTLSLVDMESMIIPDGCLIIAALAWVATAPFMGYALSDIIVYVASGIGYAAALLVLSLIMDKVLKKESMGGGDIKLVAVMGLYLGAIGTLFAAMIACIAGLIYYAIVIRRQEEPGAFPFGPFLSAAAVFMLILGGPLVSWYISLL